MKNSIKFLVLCGLIIPLPTPLVCMEQTASPQEAAVFVEAEHTKIKLAFIGKARAAEKAWGKALQKSIEANRLWQDAYIADKRGFATFDMLDRKSDSADAIMKAAEMKAQRITAEAKQLHQEIRGLGIEGIHLAWAKVKKAEAAYLVTFGSRVLFARMFQDYAENIL